LEVGWALVVQGTSSPSGVWGRAAVGACHLGGLGVKPSETKPEISQTQSADDKHIFQAVGL